MFVDEILCAMWRNGRFANQLWPKYLQNYRPLVILCAHQNRTCCSTETVKNRQMRASYLKISSVTITDKTCLLHIPHNFTIQQPSHSTQFSNLQQIKYISRCINSFNFVNNVRYRYLLCNETPMILILTVRPSLKHLFFSALTGDTVYSTVTAKITAC